MDITTKLKVKYHTFMGSLMMKIYGPLSYRPAKHYAKLIHIGLAEGLSQGSKKVK